MFFSQTSKHKFKKNSRQVFKLVFTRTCGIRTGRESNLNLREFDSSLLRHPLVLAVIGTSTTLCVGSPYVLSSIFYEFVNKNKKRFNFETAEVRNLKFRS